MSTPYQDPARPVAERVEDLLSRMTLEEKAGQLFHTMIGINADGSLYEGGGRISLESSTTMISGKLMSHFNLLGAADPRRIAEWHNRVQELAAQTRLGIPVTISTDPRNGFVSNPAASFGAKGFSQWPEPCGLAAARDPGLVRRAADIMRQEYLAVGIRVALSPMADLATEPRWARVIGTFGEDADLASEMVGAYIRGFQGETLGPDSVACMTKHFPGAGPQAGGEDAHFAYGREQVYPGGRAEYHLKPFEAAFAAGTSQIMPYYGMPVGTGWEEVGFGFNRDVITGLLRQRYGFDGIVCTDWGLVTDTEIFGAPFPARAWGAEHLSDLDRVAKILDAGCDQLGGEARPELVVQLVAQGSVSQARLDESVRRLLREKFRLGLFDSRRYVDPDAAGRIAGNSSFAAAGFDAQRRSVVVLTPLPSIPRSSKIYVEGIDAGTAAAYATVVDSPADADLAVLRIGAPFSPREGGFARLFHAGRLDYTPAELARLNAVAAQVPTVIDVFLDRPAILTGLTRTSQTGTSLIADFGASDEAVLDIIYRRAVATARLPFELPRTPEQVAKGREDVPRDSGDPLFPFGHGL
jgi:beta-glucosidase